MYKVIKNLSSGVVEIIADERNDIEDTPTYYGAGSTCFVIEDSSVQMLGNDAIQHELR